MKYEIVFVGGTVLSESGTAEKILKELSSISKDSSTRIIEATLPHL